MSEPVKKRVRVVGAQYSYDAKAFLLVVETSDLRFSTQIPIESVLGPRVVEGFDGFTKEQKKSCTDVFCKEIMGKHIDVVFDPDLDKKIKDRYPLIY